MTSSPTLALVLLVALLAACDAAPTEPIDPDDDTVASIGLSPSPMTFDALELTRQITAVAKNAAGVPVDAAFLYGTRGTGVATVTDAGVVTAVGNGIDTVRVEAGGVTADVEVRVEQVPSSLDLDVDSTDITVLGAGIRLDATATDAQGHMIEGLSITWTSSNPAVLPIEGVRAVAKRPGSSVISATAGGVTAEVNVDVTLSGPLGGPLVGAEVPCLGGMAGPFPCDQVTLMSYLPVSGVGASGDVDLNDIWGWVDPETHDEYVIVMRRDGAAFVDVTDPLNPGYLGFLPIPETATPNTWHDVKVYADHAFIVADGAGAHGMQVFDLTQLREVTVPRTFEVVTHYTDIASAHNIFINEATGFAYSVGGSSGGTTCAGGLHMIDVRVPSSPTFAGCFSDPLTGRKSAGYTHDVQCVVYDGPDATYAGREICFGSNENAISISDVTDKAAPVAISRATYPGVAYTHQGWLTADQRYLLVNDESDESQGLVTGTRTLVWDVGDLDDPILVDEHLGPTMATDHNHYIRDGRLYMSNYRAGLRVLDVRDPLALAELGSFDTSPNLSDIPGTSGTWSNYPFFPSGNVVMTSRGEGLFVLRVTD